MRHGWVRAMCWDAVSTTTWDLCTCPRFTLWYTNDEGVPVCECGHPPAEHLDERASCTGLVIVSHGGG